MPEVLAGGASDGLSSWLMLQGKRPHTLQIDSEGEVAVADAMQSATWYQDYCRRRLTAELPDGVRRMTFHSGREGCEIEFSVPGEVSLSATERNDLLNGRKLSPEHKLSQSFAQHDDRCLVWLNPFQQYSGRGLQELEQLVDGLRCNFPSREFTFDLRPEQKPAARLKQLEQIKLTRPKDIVVVTPDPSQPKSDVDLLLNRLDNAKIRTLRVPVTGELPDPPDNCRVLVVLSSLPPDELAAQYRQLGEADWFRKRLVFAAGTAVARSTVLHADVVGRFEAIGLFTLTGDADSLKAWDRFLSALAASADKAEKMSIVSQIRAVLQQLHLVGGWSL